MEPSLPFRRPAPTAADLERQNDDQLMLSLQAGYDDALAILFDRYQRLVFSIALKVLRDRGEAEDVVQNVFLDIFRSVSQFDPAKGTTKVWVLQYAYHRAINRKQHLNARSFYSQEDIEDWGSVLPQRDSGVSKFVESDLRRLLQQGFQSLSGPQKRVIELASYEGLSMKEIANELGQSLVNVRQHYYRGLRKLRAFIDQPPEMRRAVGDE